MAEVLDWQSAPNREAAIHRAAAALIAGEPIALPTDTSYGVAASALAPDAVERLFALRAPDEPLAVAIPSAAHATDWVPRMSRVGRRLARRCWPGPVTLQFSSGLEHGLVGRLPEPVRGRICPDGSLALCVPAHDATWQVLRRVPIPVVLTTLAGAGSGPPMTAAAAAQAVGDRVRLVVDGGPARDARPATVVRIDDNHWSVMRDGAVSAAELAQQTTCVIIFVCTGNTCRSPMAEALCTKLLTERLGCAANELPQRGFLVLSAGVSAMPGDSAAPEAIDVMQELGADLEGHCSRPLTAQLVGQADYLLTMTHGHQAMVRDRFGRRGPRPRLLCPEGRDVADPIGQHREVYRDCAQQILQHLERLLPELQQP